MTAVVEQFTTSLRSEVGREIVAEPSLANFRIDVVEENGVIVLSGVVDCIARKRDAEEAAFRVAGVVEVVDEIKIRWDFVHGLRDFDLMNEAPHLLSAHYLLRDRHLRVRVDGGVVTLAGRVRTLYEREEAERAISVLPSLHGVVNEIVVDGPRVEGTALRVEVDEVVERALGSSARSVDVDVDGMRQVVSLEGTVSSRVARTVCHAAVARTPGVLGIRDRLRVAQR